jgi:hypothetical protein
MKGKDKGITIGNGIYNCLRDLSLRRSLRARGKKPLRTKRVFQLHILTWCEQNAQAQHSTEMMMKNTHEN